MAGNGVPVNGAPVNEVAGSGVPVNGDGAPLNEVAGNASCPAPAVSRHTIQGGDHRDGGATIS